MSKRLGFCIVAATLLIAVPLRSVHADSAAVGRQRTLNTELYQAICAFDATEVHHLLRAGADANTPVIEFDGASPVLIEAITWIPTPDNFDDEEMRVCKAQRRQIISDLLAHHADVNASNGEGETPLLTAAIGNDYDTVALLLARYANVNAQDKQGDTALMEAAQNDELPIVRLLLGQKANVNIADTRLHETALASALAAKDLLLVRLLLQYGADPNARSWDGSSMLISTFQNIPLMQMLLKAGADPNAPETTYARPTTPAALKAWGTAKETSQSTTLLNMALEENDIPNAQPVSIKGPDGKPLGVGLAVATYFWKERPAFGKQHLVMPPHDVARLRRVEMLLAYGANPKAADADGWTPLMRAAFWGDPELLKTLLAHGANPAARDDTGHTALDYTQAAKQAACVPLLTVKARGPQ